MTINRRRALSALAAAPFLAAAQERVRIVGYLLEGEGYPRRLSAKLAELGYVEGRNLRFEVRRVPQAPAASQIDQAARELARSGAEVIVAQGADFVTALHRATSKVPIVSGGVSNPISLGLAKTLRAPGMNVTGLSYGLDRAAELQFDTLKLLRPKLKRIVFQVSINDPYADLAPEHVAAAAKAQLDAFALKMKDSEAVERALASLRESTDAAWVAGLPKGVETKHVAASAIRHRIATHGMSPQQVREGLLFCQGFNHADHPGSLARIVDKVLRGVDPGTIPFELPDRPVFAINRATAAAIGASIPEEFRLRATEVFG